MAVPTCPGWVVGDLVRHVAHALVNVALRQLNQSAEQDLSAEDPIVTLRRCHAAFVHEVSRPDGATEAKARFWLRRMTHEIAVRRVDGERATGRTHWG